jgi:hypothetical protein
VAGAIAILVISCGAIAAGWGYVRTARRMRSFATTRGTVIARSVVAIPGGSREGRFGRGGGYRPQATYRYEVDGVSHTSDRWGYAFRGLKHSLAEQRVNALPDEVEVHYDPAAPGEAYLETQTPRVGYWLVGGGGLGVLIGLIALLG